MAVPRANEYGGNFVLMDDNATLHRARVTGEYLEAEGVIRMDIPTRFQMKRIIKIMNLNRELLNRSHCGYSFSHCKVIKLQQ